MKLSLRALLNLTYIGGSLLILLVALAAYRNYQSTLAKAAWVQHTHQVITTSEQVISHLKDTETGQRGYLLAGDSTYLEPYWSGLRALPAAFTRLQELTSDNPRQQMRLVALQKQIQVRLQLLERLLPPAKPVNTLLGQDLADFAQSKKSMDQVRALIHTIQAEEQQLMAARVQELDTATSITRNSIRGVILAGLGFGLIGYLSFRRLLHQQEVYQQQLHHLNSELKEVTGELGATNEELTASNEELTASNEELAAMGEALTETNEELARSNEQLQQIKDELEKRVVERTARLEEANGHLAAEAAYSKQQEEALQLALQQLQERNHELDQYVYKVSHDLRAPLASIMGLINLMEMEESPEQVRQYLSLIKNRIYKSDDFIRSVLAHSRTLNTQVSRSPVDIEQLVRDTWEELQYLSGWEKVQLLTDLPPAGTFWSDPLRLAIICKNFFSNAIKYRNPKVEQSFLDVRVSVTEQEAFLRFEDNGLGIEQQYLGKVFNMFFRASAAAEGSGLGLYIARQAVERLEGSITVESQEGKGTTFLIRLPHFHPDQVSAGKS